MSDTEVKKSARRRVGTVSGLASYEEACSTKDDLVTKGVFNDSVVTKCKIIRRADGTFDVASFVDL